MSTTFERDERNAVAVDPRLRSERGAESPADQFDEYYREYQPGLVQYAISRNAIDPEGVVHLALLDGFGALDRMRSREPRSIKAYLYRAVTSHIAMEHRRSGNEHLGFDGSAEADGFEDGVVSRLEFDRALDMLPRDQRAVIRLRFFEDLSADEVGRILGKTSVAVRQLQLRAIRRLRRLGFTAVVLLVLLGAVALVWRWTAPQRSLVQPADRSDVNIEGQPNADLVGDQLGSEQDERSLSIAVSGEEDTSSEPRSDSPENERPAPETAVAEPALDAVASEGSEDASATRFVVPEVGEAIASPPATIEPSRPASLPAQVYEGFDLVTRGVDVANNPSVASFGFANSTTWDITRGAGTAVHDPVGLGYVDDDGRTLKTSPGAARFSATEGGTHLSRPLAASAGDTYWLAYLLRPDTDGYGDAYWSPDGSFDRGAVGIQQYPHLRYVNGPVSDTAFVTGETYLLVVRVEGTQSSLWVNPNLTTLGAPDVVYTYETMVAPERLFLVTNEFNEGAYTFDEVRIGASFEAVTPLG